MSKEERIKNVEFALAINSLGGVPPSDDCKILLQDYIDGKKEIEEITKILVEKYKFADDC